VVEDGAPAALAEQAGSTYRRMLEDERELHAGLWGDPVWHRAVVADGRVGVAGGPDMAVGRRNA
jgi:hypothetical protein